MSRSSVLLQPHQNLLHIVSCKLLLNNIVVYNFDVLSGVLDSPDMIWAICHKSHSNYDLQCTLLVDRLIMGLVLLMVRGILDY